MNLTERPDPGANLRAEALDAIDSWASEHLRLLEVSYWAFAGSGHWPTLAELDAQLRDRSHPVELAAVWGSAALGLVRTGSDRSAILLARALSFLAEASPLLDDLVGVIRLAVAKYLEAEEVAVLESSHVSAALHLDPARLDRVTKVLWSEPGLSGVRVSGAEWAWTLDDSILQYRGATSLEKYLADQAWLLWPDGPVSPTMARAVRQPGADSSQLLAPARPLQGTWSRGVESG